MARRRIVYCEGNLDGTIGGSYFSLLFLVSGLDREEFEPIVVFRRPHALMDRFREAGVEVVVIPAQDPVSLGLAPDVSQLPKWLWPIIFLRRGINFLKVFVWDGVRLAWWLRKRKANLVHLNNSVTRTHSWMLAARLIGLPCVTHERGMNATYSWISRYFAPRLARIICVSTAVRDNLIFHGIPKNNLVVIHNGIDPELYRPTRSSSEIRIELGIHPSAPVIGMVGNIRAWKGQDVVVRAIGHLVERHPDLVCVFVGTATAEKHPYRQKLTQISNELAISEKIFFVGYQSRVADYMNAMDIVLHASIDPEPFGRVLIEAMALGKPVVAARAGAVPEILDEPTCGLMFPPGDHCALAEAIDYLLTRRDFGIAMGQSGKRRVVQKFGIAQNVESTVRLYTEILE